MPLIFHIGLHKTGTSAVQEHLHRHREALKDDGLLYPQPISRFPSHGDLAWALLGDLAPWRDGDYDLTQVLRYYGKICREYPALTVLISSEDLSLLRPEHVAKLAEGFCAERPTILAYVRDPVEYLTATYRQAVREGHTTRSFKDYLSEEFAFGALHYGARLRMWEGAFGADRIILRQYKPAGGGADAVTDFCEALDLSLSPDYEPTLVNAGVHPRLTDAYRALPADRDFHPIRDAIMNLSRDLPPTAGLSAYVGDDAADLRRRLGGDYDDVLQRYARRTLHPQRRGACEPA